MRLFKKIAIVGVGLIGGSMGMAIKKRGLAREVIGVCRRIQNIRQAKKGRAIDQGFLDLEGIKNCDLLILATPIQHIIETIPKLDQFLKKGCIIIDVGSTKSKVIMTAEKFLSKDICFVGTHPLAGSEKKGIGFASADLFNNSLCIITPCKSSTKDGLKKVERLWRLLGAKTRIVSVSVHDRIVAFSSHLAHVVAFSLVDSLPKKAVGSISSGFKDTTRIALSDPVLWQDIFLTNADKLIKAIDKFQTSLDKFKDLIKKKDARSLVRLIEKTRLKRNALR